MPAANAFARLYRDEVAALVLYLCSREAGFVTGANIAINGGEHLQ